MVFYFVQTNFFGQVIIFFYFLSHKARIFFLEFNIRLYDKNSESDYFFFLYQNQNIFFSNIENPNIFLEKKHNPPFKLNDRSLIHILSKANLLLILNIMCMKFMKVCFTNFRWLLYMNVLFRND